MATKKGKIDNSSFLKKIGSEARTSAQAVDDSHTNQPDITEGTDKKLEFVDIDLMDDAPADWNDYPRLKDDQPEKYLELKMSVYNNGVKQPLLLWKTGNGRYIILAGHNRRDISKEIIAECSDEPRFDLEKYKYLPSIVEDVNEIDENQARDLIDDTNCAQRDFSKMSAELKIKITKRRMQTFERRRYSKGQRIDQLAKELGLEKTAIYENMSIADKVIKPLQELYYSGGLTRKGILKITYFHKDIQEWMYDTYNGHIDDENVKRLKKNMDKEAIKKVFESDTVKLKKITIEIPEDRVEQFKAILADFLNAKSLHDS